MQQFFIAIILVLGLGSWFLYNENQTLTANNIKLEQAVKDQREAFAKMVAEYEKQGKALSNLQRKTAQIEAEKDQYLQIFRKHNLDKLALLKPGLVELRVNKATKEIFEVLENDTKEISTITSGDNND
tara:strand:- start:2447 stop:2830 length:384 start_codon:yes stop_codon:yes gene_type:complete